MSKVDFKVIRCWECNIPLGLLPDMLIKAHKITDLDMAVCAGCAIAYHGYVGPMMLDGVKLEGEE